MKTKFLTSRIWNRDGKEEKKQLISDVFILSSNSPTHDGSELATGELQPMM
jgi:hypothetical protein